MSVDGMHVKRLELHGLPGFPIGSGGVVEEFAKQLTLISGRNGSGKTTMARAIASILWPENSSLGSGHISGRIAVGDATYEVERGLDGNCVWTQDGAQREALTLGDAWMGRLSRVSLVDLLDHEDEVGSKFSHRMSELLAGGVNWDEVQEDAGLNEAIGGHGTAARELREADTELGKKKKAAHENAKLEQKAETARKKLGDAKVARADHKACTDELARREAAQDHHAAKEKKEGIKKKYPGVSQLHDDDKQQLETRLLNLRAAKEVSKAAKKELERNGQWPTFKELPFVADRLTICDEDRQTIGDAFAQWREANEAAKTRQDAVGRREGDEKAAKGRVAKALGENWVDHELYPICQRVGNDDLVTLAQASANARGWSEAHAIAVGLRQDGLGGDDVGEVADSAIDPNELQTDVNFVIEPLQQTGAAWGRRAVGAMLLVAVAAAVTASVAAVASESSAGVVVVASVVSAVAAGLLGWTAWRAGTAERARRAMLARPAAEAVQGDASGNVFMRVEELVRSLRRTARGEAEVAVARSLDTQARGQCSAFRGAYLEQIGSEPPDELQSPQWDFLHRIGGLIRAHDNAGPLLNQAKAELNGAKDRVGAAEKTIKQTMKRYCGEVSAAGNELIEYVNEFLAVAGLWGELLTKEGSVNECKKNLKEFCDRLLLKCEPVEQPQESFNTLWQQKETYSQACADIIIARERMCQERGAPQDKYSREPNEALQARLQESEYATEEHITQLTETRATVQTKLNAASADYSIEKAIADEEAKRAKLMSLAEKSQQLEAGKAVLQWLRKQVNDEEMPGLVQRANGWLSSFTNGGLQIEHQAGQAADQVLVADGGGARRRPLSQTSDGERVQILLAVRLALIEEFGGDAVPPLILDEVLANADDERASAIIDAVLKICRAGRQVIYLSSQDDEIGKWRAAVEGLSGEGERVDFSEIRMDDIRHDDGTPMGRIAIAARQAQAPPEPGALPDEQYLKAIGGRPFDLLNGGLWPDLSIWYLFPSQEICTPLLGTGIRTAGQVKTLLRHGALGIAGAADEMARTHCRAIELVDTKLRRNRVTVPMLDGFDWGRGEKANTYLRAITSHLTASGGNARELLEALEGGGLDLPGWGPRRTDKLKEHLQEKLEDLSEQPLASGDVLAQVLGQLGEAGGNLEDGWLEWVVAELEPPQDAGGEGHN